MDLNSESPGRHPGSAPSTCNAGRPVAWLDASLDCIKALTLDGDLMSMNPEGLCLMEIEDFGALEGAAWATLWPEIHRPTLQAAVARAASGSVARFSADCPTAKGTPKHWDVLVSPVHDPAGGTVVSLLAISRDVTREVYLASERSLVTRELAHRIANLFTLVDGVIGLSARANPEAGTFARTLRTRLGGLGRAVAFVYGEHPDAARSPTTTIHGLLRELLQPYGLGNWQGPLTLSGEDRAMTQAGVTPLALVFNELGTNALKYGALATADGAVKVSTAVVADTYVIEWAEGGASDVSEPRSSGFGTTLLDRTVHLQLGATIDRSWQPDGLKLRLGIPLANL